MLSGTAFSFAALKVWDLQCEANAADLRAKCSDVRLNVTTIGLAS